MGEVSQSDVWDCMLELFDFPGCAQRRGVVGDVLLFNKFWRMKQLRNAAEASTWEHAQWLYPSEIAFLNWLATVVTVAHAERYVFLSLGFSRIIISPQ